jgi:caffeoyl-CoA O-methyltransferase
MLTLVQPDIEQYAIDKTEPQGELLAQLISETHKQMDNPQMLCGPIEGRFLKLMVMVTGAKRILEIGMFTGYSALSMAEGLADGGEVITCDINPKAIALAKSFFEKSEHGKKITIKEGPALDTIKQLKGTFDLIFIDADKENYTNYYEAVMPLLKSGGVILVDNVLWSGAVLNPKTETDRAIVAFNEHVVKDQRVNHALLPIRDGIFFIRKK